jgi:hypothetical protein
MFYKKLPDCTMYFNFKRKLNALNYKIKEIIYVLKNRDVILEYQAKDLERNLKSEPPTSESINLQCVWATEIYSTTNFENLIKSFEKLGWDNDTNPSGNNPVTWIRRQRQTEFRGGSFNLGIITREGKDKRFPYSRKALLPDYAEYAMASMYSLSKSAISVSVCFVVKDNFKKKYEEALRKKYKTYIKYINRRGFAFIDPGIQKNTSITSLRKNIRNEAKHWFGVNFPGLFISSRMGYEFPTCEHITLKESMLLSKNVKTADREWLGSLGVYGPTYVWRSDNFQKLKILWPLSIKNTTRSHAIFISGESVVDKNELEQQGLYGECSEIIYIDEHIGTSFINRAAVLSMFSGFERYLNEIRDSMPRKHACLKTSLSIAKFLSDHVLTSLNISALSEEFKNINECAILTNEIMNSFKIDDDIVPVISDVILVDSLNDNINDRIQWLGRLDILVRELLTQYSSVVSAFENIKLQRNMKFLTFVMLVATVIMLVLTAAATLLTIYQNPTLWDHFKQTMSSLWAVISNL